MGSHQLDGLPPADFEETLLASGVKLEQCGPELKTLGPFRPTARSVFAFDREDRSAPDRIAALFNVQNFSGGKLEETADLRQELFVSQTVVDFERHEAS